MSPLLTLPDFTCTNSTHEVTQGCYRFGHLVGCVGNQIMVGLLRYVAPVPRILKRFYLGLAIPAALVLE